MVPSFRCIAVCLLLSPLAMLSASALRANEPKAMDGIQPSWKAGLAKIKITPDRRMPMAGYAARKEPAEGTDTDLFAKALVVEDAKGTQIVLVTLDLIGVLEEVRNEVAKHVQENLKIPPERLVINASHTHCGPAYATEEASDYRRWVIERIEEVIQQAHQSLTPAQLTYCHARCGFAMNRRTPSEKGYLNHPMPDGPVDHDVPVLVVESLSGELKGLVFGYACHNTTLSYLKWNGDYAGYAQQYLEEGHEGCTAMFLMGCGGDQNPYPRREVQHAQSHGRSLADAVDAAIEIGQKPTRHRHKIDGLLTSIIETVPLEYADGRPDKNYLVQAVRFGDDLQWVALGSETTIDYALRLKRELAERDRAIPWIAGYSNLYDGYIPSRRVLLEGGYEAQSRPWKPDLEERIVSKVHELVWRLRGESYYQPQPWTSENGFTEGIEGPACDTEGNLYAVNFQKQGTIGKVSPQGKEELWVELPEGSVANGLRYLRDGSLFVADYTGHNIHILDVQSKKRTLFVHEPRMHQPNDLAIDREGTLYASDPDWKKGSGQIWRIDRNGKTHRLAMDQGTVNGIELSPDGKKLFVNESVQKRVWSFDIDSQKQLSNKTLVHQFADHSLDGMRCDIDGNLYITRHGKGTVVKMTPWGDILREIDVLGSMPSNLCFGGLDGKTVYVTEVQHRRVIQFRVERPGLEWARVHQP